MTGITKAQNPEMVRFSGLQFRREELVTILFSWVTEVFSPRLKSLSLKLLAVYSYTLDLAPMKQE